MNHDGNQLPGNDDSAEVLDRVRKALGRGAATMPASPIAATSIAASPIAASPIAASPIATTPAAASPLAASRLAASPVAPPIPPPLPEHIVRLVHTDIGLAELFATRAAVQSMLVELVSPDEVAPKLVEFLRDRKIGRVALAQSRLFEQLDIYRALESAGQFDSRRWPQMSLDEMYDFDCGITDVTYAVAETGTLAIVTSANNGRALSLVPMTHIAIVEPKNLLPDLLDLFDRLRCNYPGQHTVMISGPSKTADIEMNVVTGVHGPNVVKAYVIR